MTVLQDWLSFHPADQSVIRDMVFRPLRAVLSPAETDVPTELKLMTPGVERC